MEDHKKISHEMLSLQNEHEVISDQLAEFDQTLYSIDEKMTEEQILATEKFLDFVEKDLLDHFHEEEENLFPLLKNPVEKFVDPLLAHAMISQLEDEHTLIRSIHQRVRSLFSKIDNGISLDWFIASSMSLVDFIRTHARKENAVILMLTQGLTEEEMQQEIYKAYTSVHTAQKV